MSFQRGSSLTGLLVFFLLLASCATEEPKKDPAADFPADAHYYSLMGFVRDQHKMMYGQPVTLTKVTTRGTKKDTVYEALYNVKWSEIFRAVNEADISPRKYLGRYNFSDVFDSTLYLRSFVYEAAEPELPTRRFLVNINPVNDKITSVYVKYARNGTARVLYYEPSAYLRIDEEGRNAARNLRTEYYWQ